MALLTLNKIIGFKKKPSAYYEFEDDGTKGMGRLGVKIFASGSKRFVFRYFVAGKPKFIKIGDAPTNKENGISLANARAVAKQYGAMLQTGLDPKQELEQQQQVKTKKAKEEAQQGSIEQLFKSYTAQMKIDGKRTYKTVLSNLEKEVYPFVPPATKAKEVTTQDLILVLANMIKRGAPTQSNRVRTYLMASFNYGLKHDNNPANYIEDAKFGLLFNPVSAIPKQTHAERVGQHFLTMGEVKVLLADLSHEQEKFRMADSVRSLIALCFYAGGQRPYELANSKWDCINWEQKTLLIIDEVSKNKRPHLVPLTESAIAVLKAQQAESEDSPYIFPHRHDKQKPINLGTLAHSIKRYCESSEIRKFVPRDIRRTCKTLMGEIGISKTDRDRIQNHTIQDVSTKHYDRYEYLPEKQRGLQIWEQGLNEVAVGNIINFKGA
jgi:integrase